MDKKQTEKRGFTLIELMIVVAIIGILAAVAIPAFINYMTRAKTSEATLNIKTITEGVMSYYDREHGPSGLTHCLPAATTMTPDINPGEAKRLPEDYTADAVGQFGTSAWKATGWAPAEPFYYSYSFGPTIGGYCPINSGSVSGDVGTTTAIGDLDGDDVNSSFTRNVLLEGGSLLARNTVRNQELE